MFIARYHESCAAHQSGFDEHVVVWIGGDRSDSPSNFYTFADCLDLFLDEIDILKRKSE